nr:hypothetical protein [Lacticaseibacillus nasuensis]
MPMCIAKFCQSLPAWSPDHTVASRCVPAQPSTVTIIGRKLRWRIAVPAAVVAFRPKV